MPYAQLKNYLMVAMLVALSFVTGFAQPLVAQAADASTKPAMAYMKVTLTEWQIILDKHVVKKGSVTLSVSNKGKMTHEVVLLKTPFAVSVLPMENDKVDEEAAGQVVGEFDRIEPGQTKELTFPLESGHYVVFCNIVETDSHGNRISHYQKRMRNEFKVE